MKVNRAQFWLMMGALSLVFAMASAVEAKDPSGTVHLETKSVAIGIGVSWGDGTLSFNGEEHRFSISGLSVIDVGMSKATASGEVYNLKQVSDFPGNYLAAEAGFTLAGGAAGITMRNDRGVVLNIRSVTQGAQLTLAAKGLSLKLK